MTAAAFESVGKVYPTGWSRRRGTRAVVVDLGTAEHGTLATNAGWVAHDRDLQCDSRFAMDVGTFGLDRLWAVRTFLKPRP